MPINSITRVSPVDIATSGMRAEATRMNLLSSNVANSLTTKGENGEPYRRQDVVLGTDGKGGVKLLGVQRDMSAFRRVLDPSNPDADDSGYVQMPNVELPVEMMRMVTASRIYQANAAVLKRYGEVAEVTLELLK